MVFDAWFEITAIDGMGQEYIYMSNRLPSVGDTIWIPIEGTDTEVEVVSVDPHSFTIGISIIE